MTRAHIWCFAWLLSLAVPSSAAAESQPLSLRQYVQLRYGQLGSAHLETKAASLDGTPRPSFGFGYRAELALLRYLTGGLEAVVGADLGADLHRAGNEHVEGAPTDFGLYLAPRLPLLDDRLELRIQLLAGLGWRHLLRGSFPYVEPDRIDYVKATEESSFSQYYGGGVGFTTWLSELFGAFVELNVIRRHTDAIVVRELDDSIAQPTQPRRKSEVDLDETHVFVTIGFGFRVSIL